MGLYPPLPPQQLVPWALAGLLLATGLGTPIFTTLGGAALILFWGTGKPYRFYCHRSLPDGG